METSVFTDQDSSQEFMKQLVREVVQTLNGITELDPIWKHGVVHRGGPHYRLCRTLGPVSLGEDECLVFGKLIEGLRPANCFVIGNAFGMSSTFISKMMERCGGRSIITLDSKSEGDGERCFEVAAALRDRMGCRILKNKAGWSPQDIDAVVEEDSYDLIFIDGDHSHPQVTRDFEGIRHLAREDSVICWHDYWLAGVPESVEAAQKSGYRCLKVNSSCEIVLGTKSEAVFVRVKSLYPNVEEPRKRRRPIAWLKLYHALFVGAVSARLLRKA